MQPAKRARIAGKGADVSMETFLASYDPCENDPHGATSMPIYQSATFKQPSATSFGDYDYTRSGNPTRDALQKQIQMLEGSEGAKAFCFTTGMAAIAAVTRLVECGEEIVLNDDSYGGTYRLMAKVAPRQGIVVKYANLDGSLGPKNLEAVISSKTKLVMIESPTNPNQRICDIRKLSAICRASGHEMGTLLFIDNTMMSPILSRPLEIGADLVMHSATKYFCGHSDTMAGVVTARQLQQGEKTLAEQVYFYQNAEGTGLAPFDCWLVLRGMRTMAIRVEKQQQNAATIAQWLKTKSCVTQVLYAGLQEHPDHELHMTQAAGGGAVVCFLTGDVAFSKHIVTVTKLFKITVSFGNVSSLISIPGDMSHASIPSDVKAAREFPLDLVRMSIGIESAADLIQDLEAAMTSYSSPSSTSSASST